MSRRRKVTVGFAVLLVLAGITVWLLRPDRLAQIDSFAECVKAGFPVQETQPPTCNDGRQTYAGPAGTPLPTMEPIQDLDYQVLVEGDSEGTYPAKNQLITTAAAWQAFWKEVHRSISPLPNLIPVDFSQNDVIALNMGPQPTDGYSIRLLSLVTSGGQVTASVQLRQPGKDCRLPTKATGPYYLAMVPKISAPLKYSLTTVTRNCGG